MNRELFITKNLSEIVNPTTQAVIVKNDENRIIAVLQTYKTKDNELLWESIMYNGKNHHGYKNLVDLMCHDTFSQCTFRVITK